MSNVQKKPKKAQAASTKTGLKILSGSPNKKLPQQEKKRFVTAMKKRKAANPQTAQDTIPYLRMYRDGVCRVTERLYTKMLEFQDITYQLANNEDKTVIFENYCDFLNYFDSSITVQFTFINQSVNMKDYEKTIDIPPQSDGLDDIRNEYAGMLKDQLAKGNNGLQKHKYITFGIEADDPIIARQRLERIEMDVKNNFKVLGVRVSPLNGYDRLKVLHDIFHADSKEPFIFNWDLTYQTGLSTKDFIAPTSFSFREDRTFTIGRKIGAVSYLQILAPELSDRMLADYLDIDTDLIVNMHIRSIDQNAAVKLVKRKITDLDKMKIEEQKKAVRSGYDMDIIPSDLSTYGDEAKNLLKDLKSRNERMFLVTVLVMNTADDKKKLDNAIFAAAGVAQKYNCTLKPLDFQQENALASSLPLGRNLIPIQRGLTTSSTAIFVPFTTQELFSRSKQALYYGLNALSNNMIMADRKELKTPNGLILGTPGAGKSFSAKREIVNVVLLTNDQILVCDPESEYGPLTLKLGGQVIELSPNSKQFINPLDINLNYSEDDNPLTLKSDFVLSFCELICGGRNGLEPIERTVIDRCVSLIYREYIANPKPENVPVLGDLYRALRDQPEPEAQRVATALEMYVTGTLNVFNNRTNITGLSDKRMITFDIRRLGKALKKLGMLILEDQAWNMVTVNRFEGHRATRFYIDEFHLLFKDPQTAAYSVEIWQRFRKWNGIPTGITQNVKTLLLSPEIENIFDNSDFVYMLNQAPGDRSRISKALGLSPQQLSYITNSNEGEGLLYFGDTVIPFADHFPKDTLLYTTMTTKPSEANGV